MHAYYACAVHMQTHFTTLCLWWLCSRCYQIPVNLISGGSPPLGGISINLFLSISTITVPLWRRKLPSWAQNLIWNCYYCQLLPNIHTHTHTHTHTQCLNASWDAEYGLSGHLRPWGSCHHVASRGKVPLKIGRGEHDVDLQEKQPPLFHVFLVSQLHEYAVQLQWSTATSNTLHNPTSIVTSQVKEITCLLTVLELIVYDACCFHVFLSCMHCTQLTIIAAQ